MSGLEDQFAIIGGSAASVLMEEQELDFRPTKDIDLVILTNASDELNSRIATYVKTGGYKVKEATEGSPRYYRFSRPVAEVYPNVLEIFARNESEIVLDEGQYVIPVADTKSMRLSAILLDERSIGLFLLTSNGVRPHLLGRLTPQAVVNNLCFDHPRGSFLISYA
jgi:hypothetical protein